MKAVPRSVIVVIAAIAAFAAGASAAGDLSRFNTTPEQREQMREKGYPVVYRRVAPLYPKQALDEGIEGCVVIGATVGTDGVPDEFQVLNSEPPGVFDQAALEAIFQWRFEPRDKPYKGSVPITFHVQPPMQSRSRIPPKRPKHCDTPSVKAIAKRAASPVAMKVAGVSPYFPPDAVRSGIEGCVTVSFDVTPDGLADNYEFVHAEPAKTFEESVVWALNQWQFEAAKNAVRAAVSFSFNLKDNNGEGEAAVPECPLPPQFVEEFGAAS